MTVIDNGDLEEFLVFLQNFKMTLEASGTLASSAKIQYICRVLCGEALHQFDTLCAQVESTNTTHLNRMILGLGAYFFRYMCRQRKIV